jgi:hypothetical protein
VTTWLVELHAVMKGLEGLLEQLKHSKNSKDVA